MSRTVHKPCPHCHRLTAVIGRAGQLARHRCSDNPATMTPAERVRVARDLERRARRNREHAVDDLRHAERVHAWAGRLTLAGAALALIACTVAWVVVNPEHIAAGYFWAAAATAIAWRKSRKLAERVAGHRAKLAALDDAYGAALGRLLELEAALPGDVVWPEIHRGES